MSCYRSFSWGARNFTRRTGTIKRNVGVKGRDIRRLKGVEKCRKCGCKMMAYFETCPLCGTRLDIGIA